MEIRQSRVWWEVSPLLNSVSGFKNKSPRLIDRTKGLEEHAPHQPDAFSEGHMLLEAPRSSGKLSAITWKSDPPEVTMP